MQVARLLAFPISLIYSAVLFLRNRLYDWGILSSRQSPIKTIVVGNLSLGGTGKTPTTEYLIRLLQNEYSLALVSRGYGRNTTGQVTKSSNSTFEDIGDEPMQIGSKFPDIQVIVDGNRLDALIEAENLNCNLAVLDDAFQHRALKGDINILLTRFDRPWSKDWVIPTGTLRDHRGEKKRADLVLVTHTPPEIGDEEKNNLVQKLAVDVPVFFAGLEYESLSGLRQRTPQPWPEHSVLLTALANPHSLLKEANSKSEVLNHMKFPDHHSFTASDIRRLREIIGNFADRNPAVVTTEKDATRLIPWMRELDGIDILVLPIRINVYDNDKFQQILWQLLNSAGNNI